MVPARHCGLLLLFSVLLPYVIASRLLLEHEPTEHLKTHLLSAVGSNENGGPWKDFVSAREKETTKLVSAMRKNIQTHLKGKEVSVLFSKEGKTLFKSLSPGVMLNTSIILPRATVLSLIGITLPILLEDYKKDVLTEPIGNILRGDDVENSLVKGHESLSLFDLLTKLPKTDSSILQDPALFRALFKRGNLALYYVNAVLGPGLREAWVDATFSVGMEMTRLNKAATTLTGSFEELQQYLLMLDHELSVVDEVSKSKLYPLDGERFLFHWWLNCPKDSTCLFPRLPRDTIINFSPDLQLYILPSSDLSLIVLGGTKQPPTLESIIQRDKLIWNQIYSVLDPTAADDEAPIQEEGREESSTLANLIYKGWPILVFVFFIVTANVWVYWLIRVVRYLATFISNKAHVPRPKTAKQE